MKKTDFLICPDCQGTRFNQLVSAKYNADNIDFRAVLPPIDQEVVYICLCGHVINKNTANATEQIVIITGESAGYQRRAILSTGLELPKELDWKDFIVLKEIIFITNKTWKSPPTALIRLLKNKKIIPYDVSDGNFDLIKDLLKLKKEVK